MREELDSVDMRRDEERERESSRLHEKKLKTKDRKENNVENVEGKE